jgi:Domain of unknown function (DUF6398)
MYGKACALTAAAECGAHPTRHDVLQLRETCAVTKKKGRHSKGAGGRVTPKGTQPGHGRPRPLATIPAAIDTEFDDDPDLLTQVRRALGRRGPLDLLALVSGIVEACTPVPLSGAPISDLGALVESFAEIDRTETTALLAVFGALVEGEVGAIARQASAGRRDPLPNWLVTINEVNGGAPWIMHHVLDDGDNYFIEARWPDGTPITVIVYIDTNLGWIVKDAFAVAEPVARVIRQYRRALANDPAGVETTFVEFDAADTRARINEALDSGRRTYPPYETDSWPTARPLVEWIVRKLPEGGRGFDYPDWDDAARAALIDGFRSSEFATACAGAEFDTAVDAILWYGCDYSGGDPLRWSPVRVELFLADWVLRKIAAPAAELRRVPEVLIAFVEYAHTVRGIPRHLTADTVAAIEHWAPQFLEDVDRPRSFGAEALARVVAGRSAFLDEDDDVLGDDDYGALWLLELEVGGRDALQSLDAAPIPDEPFAWTGVAEDIRPVVEQMRELIDGCCDALLDVECRTICRRVLARAAARSPEVFRRKARTDIGAAAIVWLVGQGNNLFGSGSVSVSAVCEHFGIASGNLSDRANTLRKAAGIFEDEYRQSSWSIRLGDAALLHSRRRLSIIAQRDG